MKKSEHTPTPWRVGDAGNTVFGPKTDKPAPQIIADLMGCGENRKANAAFIVRAVNSHDLLVNALEAVLDAGYLEGAYQPTIDMVHAALAAAKGEA